MIEPAPLICGEDDHPPPLPPCGRATAYGDATAIVLPLSLVERGQGVWGSPTPERSPSCRPSISAPHLPPPSPPGRGGEAVFGASRVKCDHPVPCREGEVWRRTLAALFFSLLFALLAAPALAQDDPSPEDAARLEREAQDARAAAARLEVAAAEQAEEIARLQLALVEAARERGGGERAANALQARLDALGAEEAALVARIDADRESLRDVFAALARMERARPPALLASSDDALAAARAARLLTEIAPALEERAAEALDRLDALAAVRAEIAVEHEALAHAETALSAQGEEIAALIQARTVEQNRLRADSADQAARAAALAAEAQTLRELLAAIEERAGDYNPDAPAERLAALPTPRLKPSRDQVGVIPSPFVPATGRFSDARGSLAPPAAGRIVARFGDRDGADAREGMVFRTRQGALVTSPFDARIEYAGPFRGYGRLLILSVGDDYHIVLAGLGAIYGATGQTVLAGEPVGEMAGAESTQDLYVEIRREGQPIDPGPWWRGG